MKNAGWLCTLSCLLWLGTACQSSPSQPTVVYQSGAPIGSWNLDNGGTLGGAGAGSNNNNGGGTLGGAGSDSNGGSGTTGGGSSGIDGNLGGGAGSSGSFAAGGSGGTTGGAAGMVASGGTVTFDVLTHSQNGRYAPRNVGAIWVETASGQFVKSLEVWAFLRRSHLDKWNLESGGSTVDAVVSATLSDHKTHHVTWDMLDAAGNPVPDGAYKIIVEVTDYNGAGKFTSVDFMKGAGPMTLMPSDQQYYTGMQLVVQ
jgi:hypothetical protein